MWLAESQAWFLRIFLSCSDKPSPCTQFLRLSSTSDGREEDDTYTGWIDHDTVVPIMLVTIGIPRIFALIWAHCIGVIFFSTIWKPTTYQLRRTSRYHLSARKLCWWFPCTSNSNLSRNCYFVAKFAHLRSRLCFFPCTQG